MLIVAHELTIHTLSSFSLKDGKAPGLNGYNSMFFKKALPIIYKDVISSITSFFSFSQFWCYLKRHELYSHHLVPKVPNHTLYKCIFPNGLTSLLLPTVIDQAQSDIVSGKRIAVKIWTRFVFYTHISVTECIDIETINYNPSPLAPQPLGIISGQHVAMNWKRLPEYVVCNHSIKWPVSRNSRKIQ